MQINRKFSRHTPLQQLQSNYINLWNLCLYEHRNEEKHNKKLNEKAEKPISNSIIMEKSHSVYLLIAIKTKDKQI